LQHKIAPRLAFWRAAILPKQAYKNLTVHHHFHSILPTFLYQNFPKLPFTNSPHFHHLIHFLTIIKPTFQSQIHQSKPPSNHNHSKLSQTSQNFPFTIFPNHKWPPTKETLAQRKPPTPSHPQANPNVLVPHPNHPKTPSISSTTKPKSSINL
jgi:hypothetical protein